ncbi:MAG: PIN domain-containing protein [Clostridia bacterium]|nr:PIN domain-containing protein [Clostridia bacterium]
MATWGVPCEGKDVSPELKKKKPGCAKRGCGAVAELVWTLESFYDLPKSRIREVLSAFLAAEGVEPEERSVVLAALEDYAEQNVDFIDAYLARHALARGLPRVFTFDRKHFSRLPVETLPEP